MPGDGRLTIHVHISSLWTCNLCNTHKPNEVSTDEANVLRTLCATQRRQADRLNSCLNSLKVLDTSHRRTDGNLSGGTRVLRWLSRTVPCGAIESLMISWTPTWPASSWDPRTEGLGAAQRMIMSCESRPARRCYQWGVLTSSVAFVAVALFWQLATGHNTLSHLTAMAKAQACQQHNQLEYQSEAQVYGSGSRDTLSAMQFYRTPQTLPLWMPRFRPHIYLDLRRMKFAHGFSVFQQRAACALYVIWLVTSWLLSTLGTWVWVYA